VEVKANGIFSDVIQKRLVIVTGKGGVGKTTASTAFALAAARKNLSVLLAEIRAPRRIPPLFGVSADKDGPLRLGPGITWMNLTPDKALETYAMKLLRFRSVYRAVFEQRMVRRFLKAIPSLAEILMLGHLTHILESEQYDLAIVDAPSSGSGAQMLAAPREVTTTVSSGPLHDGARWINALLTDPSRCMINLVVLPEELPVTEAIELHHHLRDDLGLPLGLILANRILEDPFDPATRQIADSAESEEAGHPLIVASSLYRSRLKLQELYLDRLRAGVDLPTMLLPEVIRPPERASVARVLADGMFVQSEATRN